MTKNLGLVFCIIFIIVLLIYLNDSILHERFTIEITTFDKIIKLKYINYYLGVLSTLLGLSTINNSTNSLLLFTTFLIILILFITYYFSLPLVGGILGWIFLQFIFIQNNFWRNKSILYDNFGIKITRNWTHEEIMEWINKINNLWKNKFPNINANIDYNDILNKVMHLKEKNQIIIQITELIKDQYIKSTHFELNGITWFYNFISSHPGKIILAVSFLAITILGCYYFNFDSIKKAFKITGEKTAKMTDKTVEMVDTSGEIINDEITPILTELNNFILEIKNTQIDLQNSITAISIWIKEFDFCKELNQLESQQVIELIIKNYLISKGIDSVLIDELQHAIDLLIGRTDTIISDINEIRNIND